MCKSIYLRQLLCFILLFLSYAFLSAQGHSDYTLAEELYQSKSFDLCQVKLKKILSVPTSYHDSTLAASHKLIGDLHLKKYELKETIAQYKIADTLYLALGVRHAPKRLNVVNKIGICYAQQDNLIMTAKYFQTAYDIAASLYKPSEMNMAKAINNLATVYLYIEDFDQSLKYFNESALIKENFAKENPAALANTYENMASIYGQINQMAEAETYLNKAGQLYKMKHSENEKALLGYYINMAGFYLDNDRVEDALKQLRLGESLPDKYKEDKLNVLLVNKNLGVAYLAMEEYEKALSYFKKTLLQIDQYQVGQKDLAIINTHMAGIFAEQNHDAKAIKSMEVARMAMTPLYEKTHKNYLTLLQSQISILMKMGSLNNAKALMNEYDENVDKRNQLGENDLMFSNLKMGSLSMRLNYNAKLYEINKQQIYLNKGVEIAESTIAYQDKVLSSIDDRDSKLYFFKNAYANFSTSIYLYLEKFESSSDQAFLEKAFRLSEKAKHYSLKEARGLRMSDMEESIPKELLDAEKQSKIELGQIVSKFENQLDKESKPDVMLSLINAIDSLKHTRKLLIEKMKSKSSLLSKYLDDDSSFALKKAEKYLDEKKKTYVSYFLSGNELFNQNFAFVLNAEGLTYRQLSLDQNQLDTLIKKLINSLKIDFNKSISEEVFSAFEEPASQLYELLIAQLPIQTNEALIFNLHNNLHTIPFGALKENLSSSYLIEKSNISYISSLRALIEENDSAYAKNLLVSSPVFDKVNKLNLSPLENNILEAEEVIDLVGHKDIKIANDKQKFIDEIKNNNYNIIHLATHAAANQKRGYKSYLAFGGDSTQLLYSREIYGLPISANLVVLSACESGDGEIIESQGVLGLSAAFAATNSKSMLASLWNVNDNSTRKLMSAFYKHIEAGKDKDVALRNAKLDYLSSVPKSKQHPYYWASFIQMGSVEPLQFNATMGISFFGISIFAGLMLLLFLGYFIKHIQK